MLSISFVPNAKIEKAAFASRYVSDAKAFLTHSTNYVLIKNLTLDLLNSKIIKGKD